MSQEEKSNYEKLINVHGTLIKSDWVQTTREELNESWRESSQKIALKILREIRQRKITQAELAEKMNVSPQVVSKWVKGNENFTLETIAKLERALEIKLINIDIKTEKQELPPLKYRKTTASHVEVKELLYNTQLLDILKMRTIIKSKYDEPWPKTH